MAGVLVSGTNVMVSNKFYEHKCEADLKSVLTRFHRKEILLPLALARRLLDEPNWKILGNDISSISGQVIGYRLDAKAFGRCLEVFNPQNCRLIIIDGIPATAQVNGREVNLRKEPYYMVSISPVKTDARGNIVLSDGKPIWQYDVTIDDSRIVFTPVDESAVFVTPLIREYGDSDPVAGLPNREIFGSVIGSMRLEFKLEERRAFAGLPVFRNRFPHGGTTISAGFVLNAAPLVAEVINDLAT